MMRPQEQDSSPAPKLSGRSSGEPIPPPFPMAVPWRAVAVFVAVAMGLSWLVALPLWVGGEGLADPRAVLLLPVMMFTPLIAVLVVVQTVQRDRPAPLAEFLGLWPLRPLKRTSWMIVAGILGSLLIVMAGVFLSAALGLIRLDLTDFSGFRATLQELGTPVGSVPVSLLVLAQVLAIPVGGVVNGVFALGEELGWRGWLLPSLRPLGTWPALLISGAIFGLWHTPVILLGYNFDQPNLLGVAMMTVAAMLVGVLFGWLRLRSASVWPAVFAHGTFNAAAGFGALVIAADSNVDMVSAGPLGWAAWIVMALVIAVLVFTGQFSKQPALERARPS